MSEHTVAGDDGRLDAVREHIDEAKAAAADLHDRDVLGDTGSAADAPGGPDDDHGTFEPSGDDRQAGENPGEGADAATPGEADDGPESAAPEHRDEPASVEQFDGPGPNPL